MSRSVTALAPAKINLHLGVGGLRPDGFHTLATVYQAISVYDEVTVTSSSATTLDLVGMDVDVNDVPTDDRNLALRAVTLLARHGGLDPSDSHVAMDIRKRVPVAGGMAGGSADAAAALLACDELWGLHTPREELMELAARLGSDVPFCLLGGTAAGTGRGEVVSPVEDNGSYWWVVAMPGGGLSTPEVYQAHDRLQAGVTTADAAIPETLLDALRAGDTARLAGLLVNDLQAAAVGLRPELGDLLARGRALGALGAMVSGSGPTCLFLAGDEDEAATLRARLGDAGLPVHVASGPAPGARIATGPVTGRP